jgi:membrane peptidoglycan carboxypeptidase
VVNEKGGTAGRARLHDVVVAGKTGTAQAKREGHQDTIAWFVCFAPFEKPKYAVCVMVQGGAHGGSVAAPIAAKILDESLALDRGDYEPQLVALKPASKPHPFAMIDSVEVQSAAPQPEPAVASTDAEPAAPSEPTVTSKPREHQPKPTIKRGRRVVDQPSAPELQRAEEVETPIAHKNFFRWFSGRR